MDTDKKNKSSVNAKQSLVTTSGLSAALIQLINTFVPDEATRVSLSTFAPFLAGSIVYVFAGFINRYGFESPETAQTRKKLKKDIAEIDKQLKRKNNPPKAIEKLEEQRLKAVLLLTSLGSENTVASTSTSTSTSKA